MASSLVEELILGQMETYMSEISLMATRVARAQKHGPSVISMLETLLMAIEQARVLIHGQVDINM